MSNLVDRLNKAIRSLDWEDQRQVVIEAVDTIESLRRELEDERARDIHSCGPSCTRNGCVNRRLRVQLAEKDAELLKLKQELLTSFGEGEELSGRLAEKDAEIERLKLRAIRIHRENVAAIRQELVEIGLLSEERGWIRHGGIQDFLTLEAEIMLLRQSIGGRIDGADLMKKLAASQAYAQQLREALVACIDFEQVGGFIFDIAKQALDQPTDTSATDIAQGPVGGTVMRVVLEALEAGQLTPEERLEIISDYAMSGDENAVEKARQRIMEMDGIPRGFGKPYHNGWLFGRHGITRPTTYTGDELKEWKCGKHSGTLPHRRKRHDSRQHFRLKESVW